ncbi:hypothetical protein FGG08_005392 [Glutinoglossum americanum]|uniref:Uncharacterized protein n=1 Tax=Glutinoglossum americanum TaxID=1670608 RepID=A0A9P8I3C8_9PEZI|nr:hypothetical protein FGG08_005392 [Glutinoglossum americanum]
MGNNQNSSNNGHYARSGVPHLSTNILSPNPSQSSIATQSSFPGYQESVVTDFNLITNSTPPTISVGGTRQTSANLTHRPHLPNTNTTTPFLVGDDTQPYLAAFNSLGGNNNESNGDYRTPGWIPYDLGMTKLAPPLACVNPFITGHPAQQRHNPSAGYNGSNEILQQVALGGPQLLPLVQAILRPAGSYLNEGDYRTPSTNLRAYAPPPLLPPRPPPPPLMDPNLALREPIPYYLIPQYVPPTPPANNLPIAHQAVILHPTPNLPLRLPLSPSQSPLHHPMHLPNNSNNDDSGSSDGSNSSATPAPSAPGPSNADPTSPATSNPSTPARP